MDMEGLANLVAVLHLGYFLFVVGGFAGILCGLRLNWTWIYNSWFRITHLLAALIICAEDVFDFRCPLNVLESDLRTAAVHAAPNPDSVSRLLDILLRHTIPGWFLDSMYWTLSVVLLLLLFLKPPRFGREGRVNCANQAIPESASAVGDPFARS